MGQCFSAMKGSGGGARQKPGKLARPNDANHMGPEGVESSIFHAKDEPLFPKRDPASTGAPPNAEAAGDDINAELAPLNELSGVNGAAANGFPPPPPKQAVMRRSFPPVGVSLVMQDTMNEVLASPERMANVQDEVVRTIANVFMTQKERFRVMHFKPSDPPAAVTIQMNIVADRTENDMRSPMQLAAELVTQSQDARSPLRAAPVFQALRSGSIAEDPFPGTKQDSWAGGVATLRPGGVEGAPEAKKKKKAASFKTKAPPAAAAPPANAAAPPGNFAQTNGGQQDAAAGPKPATPAVPVAPMDMAASPAPAAPAQQLTAKELAATNTSELPGGTMLKDGGEYTGDLQQGLRHGRGTHVYPNGDVFNGIFQKDKRFGIGRLVLANDGGFYLGEWKDDERSGKGSLTYGNKDMYIGTWVKGMREGDGKLCWATGAWYQGQFKKDLMHGAGILQNENQDRYDGEFFDGKRHGKGTWTPAGGAPRAGYWCMDEEVVGKSEDEALQMISEGVSKANKPVPASSHSDELAAKLSHRNARNEALANEHAQQQEGGAADGARRSAADSGAVVGGAANKQGGTGAAAGMAALSQPPPPQDKSPPKGSAQVADLQMATPGASADTSPSQPAPRRDDPQAEDSAHPPQRPPVTAPDASKPPGPDDRRGVPAAPAASMVASAGQKGSGAGAPTTSKKAASISEAKPPTRPQRSGASMSTNDTLKMVSDKLAAWQASGASLNYGD